MRQGFKDIVEGWALYSGMENLTERIDLASDWTTQNGPLKPDEQATIELMIQCQIARGMEEHGW